MLFLLALVPRVVGLTWGLPSSQHWFSFHPDERQVAEAVIISLDPLNGDFSPNFFNYPSLFLYATWLANFLLGGLGVSTPIEPNVLWPQLRDATFAGRIVCAAFGAATIPLVFAWARHIASEKIALLAAILCALSPGLVQHSHFATVDVPATFFVVLCLYFSTRAQLEDELKARSKYLGLAALASGLGAATKYNAILVVIAPLAVAMLQAAPKYLRVATVKSTLRIVGISLLGFVLGCPYSVLSFGEFWGSTDAQKQIGFAFELLTHPKIGSALLFDQTGNGWFYHGSFTLPFALLWPMWIAALIGALLMIRDRHNYKYLWPALAFCALYFLAIGTSKVRYMRYVFPIVPPLLLLAAIAIGESRRWPKYLPWKLHKRLPQVLGGALVLASTWGARDVAYPFTQVDARDQSAKYLREQPAMTSTSPPLLALTDQPGFYTPTIVPQNGKLPPSVFSLPTISPDGKFRVDVFRFNTQRLQSERPTWLVVSEFETMENARLRREAYLLWAQVLGSSYQVAQRWKVQAPLCLPGREYVPHDFLYANPEVQVWKRR